MGMGGGGVFKIGCLGEVSPLSPLTAHNLQLLAILVLRGKGIYRTEWDIPWNSSYPGW